MLFFVFVCFPLGSSRTYCVVGGQWVVCGDLWVGRIFLKYWKVRLLKKTLLTGIELAKFRNQVWELQRCQVSHKEKKFCFCFHLNLLLWRAGGCMFFFKLGCPKSFSSMLPISTLLSFGVSREPYARPRSGWSDAVLHELSNIR